MIAFKDISIIIPVGPCEEALDDLLNDLRPIEKEAEIIIVKGSHRARQLNEGVQKATREFLWFLHADSRLTPTPKSHTLESTYHSKQNLVWGLTSKTLAALLESLNNNPHALHYFNLRFLKDSPPLMFINEIGCWIRSQWMGVPFGDQGFCLSRMNFDRIGGFPEDVPYGEDHVFVWRAHQNQISLRSTRSILKTSARKYRDQGWWRITTLYYRLWTGQARAEREKLKRIQNGQTSALAVFVKTPGITPSKTRLAHEIGKEAASAFYELCLQAIQSTLSDLKSSSHSSIFPYWAVASITGLSDSRWADFGRLWQGDGDLGERLHHVYSMLQSVYKNVLLIGADTPHVSQDLILQAHRILEDKNKFVIGPARDGGFYLFGGAKALPKEIWTSVTYSQPQTCDDLATRIKNCGDVILLPTLSDVDVASDLPFLMQELQNTDHPAQREIQSWIETTLQRMLEWT